MNQVFSARCRQLATFNASILASLCAIAAISGLLIAMHYEPTAERAYASLRAIARSVAGGSWMLALHDVTGNGLILTSLLQLILMFLCRQANRLWTWVWFGTIGLALVAIALSWSATVLDWTQESYWRFAIALQAVEAIPAVGATLKSLLVGGSAVSTTTLTRMYALHGYALTALGLGAAIAHLTGVYRLRYEAMLDALNDESDVDTSYAALES